MDHDHRAADTHTPANGHDTEVFAEPEPGHTPPRAAGGVLGPIRVSSAVDEVADRLLTAIALGEFSVGERLPTERELTDTLGVSRPTVRTAIARLRGIGCLEVVRGRTGGHFVCAGWRQGSGPTIRRVLQPRWEDTTALLDTYCLVESLIVRTAAERRTETDRAAIVAALADYESAIEGYQGTRGAEQVRRAAAALHWAITNAAHNDHLAAYSRQLLQHTSAGFPIELCQESLVGRSRPRHHALANAVIDADPDRAAHIVREHFTITELQLRATLDAAQSEQ
ncbi:MAG: FadR/GntR family transcriptional regulator [Sciscionella sp.]